MSTYADCKTDFLSILNRRDCTDPLADTYLQQSIQRIQRIPRIPAMEKSVEVTLDDDTYFTDKRLAIPSDYLKLKDIIVNGEVVMSRRDLRTVLGLAANSTGTPIYFAREGGAWAFAPTPQDVTVIRIDYYAEFADTVNPADVSALTLVAKDLVVYGALSYACDRWNDKRGDRFEQRFTQIVGDIQAMADDDELTGGAQVAPAYEYPHEEDQYA